jgi:hypothetical protein
MEKVISIILLFLCYSSYSQNVLSYYFKYHENRDKFTEVNSNKNWDYKRVVTIDNNRYVYKYGVKTPLSESGIHLPILIEDYSNTGSLLKRFYVDKYNIMEMQGNPMECGINNGVCYWYIAGGIWLKGFYKNGNLIGSVNSGQKLGCLDGDCDNGTGLIYYTDGSYYQGEFRGGKLDGYGTFYLTNGRTLSGQFSYNRFISQQTNDKYNKITAQDIYRTKQNVHI